MFWIAVGKYGKERFKAFLPWNRGRGIWIRYHNRAGKEYDRYIKAPLSGRFCDFSEKEKFFLESCYNQLFDDTGNLTTTKESAYGIPLYHVFENAPTNVLPLYRNFEQDINYFKELITTIDQAIKLNDEELALQLQTKIYEKMFLLKDEFKYLPDARKICLSLLSIPTQEKNEDGSIKDFDHIEILKNYKEHIKAVLRILKTKDKSLVTFSDFFNQGNLSGLISNLVSLVYTTGYLDAMTNIKKEKYWNWILMIIMVIGFLVVGTLIVQQGKKLDTIQTNLNQLNYDMNIIRPAILQGIGVIEPTRINVIDGNVVNKPVVK